MISDHLIKPGLLSVTFRQLPATDIIKLASQASLAGIEWGGDIHLPPGNAAEARRLGRQTREAGLAVSAYGSYYRVGISESDNMPFAAVLESAVELGAPVIRVWAGKMGSTAADAAYREMIIDDSRRIAAMADTAKIAVAYEYHSNTLTDTNESALQLLREVDHPNIRTFW